MSFLLLTSKLAVLVPILTNHQEQKRSANAQPPMSPPATTTSAADYHSHQSHQQQQYNPLSNSRSNPPMPSRPTVTAPQPLRALDRRPSGSGMPGGQQQPGRTRSPSSSTAFSDLAHQGKRQLNQLIGFLDKGGKDSIGGGRGENSALRTVRAKREADEAGACMF